MYSRTPTEFSMSNYIIMSVYQGDSPGPLREALTSLLAASGDCDVLLGVDGSVGPDLADAVSATCVKSPRLRVFRYSENRGLALVLNDLIEHAVQDPTCEFVSRMDSDDVCAPDRFTKQFAFLRDHPDVDVLGSFAWLIDESGVRYAEIKKSCFDHVLKRRLPFDAPFVHPSVAFRAEVFRAGHRYPTTTVRFEDIAMWSELALAGYVFGNIPEHLLMYRQSKATISRRAGWLKALSELKVRSSYTWRRMPWRADVFVLIGLVSLSKLLLPPAVQRRLFSVRSKLLQRFG
jgi:glycosyltransferase involved in cell wall biosynthesis